MVDGMAAFIWVSLVVREDVGSISAVDVCGIVEGSVLCADSVTMSPSILPPFPSLSSLNPLFPLPPFFDLALFTVHTVNNTINDTRFMYTNNKCMTRSGTVGLS